MQPIQSKAVDGAALTRFLLGCGLCAGPFYLSIGLAQAFLRDGFVFARHSLSVLANGPGGWVQTANFVLTGLMVLAAAAGFRRVLRSPALTWFLGGYGAAMLVASVFRADPVDGFPPGTPLGVPASMSTSGLVHLIAGALGFLFLATSCFLATPATERLGIPVLARISRVSGVVVLLGFFGGIFLPMGVIGIWIAVVAGWAWLSALSLRSRRQVGQVSRPAADF